MSLRHCNVLWWAFWYGIVQYAKCQCDRYFIFRYWRTSPYIPNDWKKSLWQFLLFRTGFLISTWINLALATKQICETMQSNLSPHCTYRKTRVASRLMYKFTFKTHQVLNLLEKFGQYCSIGVSWLLELASI